MKEELLHYIWQSKRLHGNVLQTISGESIEIDHPGIYNKDAGPDFFNARIKIGNTTWAGNIEIHTQSSDWDKHLHHRDPAYDNVILHVVYLHDKVIANKNKEIIPTLELKTLLPPFLLKRYQLLQKNESFIPCEQIMKLPEAFSLQSWLTRLLTERLEEKTSRLETILRSCNNSWEDAFYIFTARYFGMKTNSEPFEWLARNIPLRVLGKHKNNLHQIKALLFGVAGFAGHPKFPQYNYLAQEADFLIGKYALKTIPAQSWKFAKTRPQNFPDVRIEQFAQLIYHASHLFSKVMEASDLKSLEKLYHFKSEGSMSTSSIHLLLINSVLPALFLYGKLTGNPDLCERALSFIEKLPAEKNAVTRYWKSKDISVNTAFESQALLQLNNAYCTNFKCLQCTIGHSSLWQ
jgi:hypothetical protein